MNKLVDVDTTSAAVDDTYKRLLDLVGQTWLRGRIKDGTLTFHTSGVTVWYGSNAPGSATGSQYSAGSGLSWGGDTVGWRIENIWLKETVGAGGAVCVFTGVVELDA